MAVDKTPLPSQETFRFGRPMRKFKVTFRGGTPQREEMIEREMVYTHDGFVWFANGGENQFKTDVVGINANMVFRIDEIDLTPPPG